MLQKDCGNRIMTTSTLSSLALITQTKNIRNTKIFSMIMFHCLWCEKNKQTWYIHNLTQNKGKYLRFVQVCNQQKVNIAVKSRKIIQFIF